MNAIKFYRKNVGLSQLQLAEKVGVDRSTVAKWETGICIPTGVEKLRKLSSVLRCSIDDLFGQPA